MIPENVLTFLLVVRLQLSLHSALIPDQWKPVFLHILCSYSCWKQAFYPWMNICYFVKDMFNEVLSIGIFFAWIPLIICRVRISNAILPSELLLGASEEVFRKRFVFSWDVRQIFRRSIFWFRSENKIFAKQIVVVSLQKSLSPPSTFLWTVALGSPDLSKCYTS